MAANMLVVGCEEEVQGGPIGSSIIVCFFVFSFVVQLTHVSNVFQKKEFKYSKNIQQANRKGNTSTQNTSQLQYCSLCLSRGFRNQSCKESPFAP